MWFNSVYPPDYEHIITEWGHIASGRPTTFEMRWKVDKTDPKTGKIIEGFQWTLASCVPVLDDTGKLVSVAGNLVDISVRTTPNRYFLGGLNY